MRYYLLTLEDYEEYEIIALTTDFNVARLWKESGDYRATFQTLTLGDEAFLKRARLGQFRWEVMIIEGERPSAVSCEGGKRFELGQVGVMSGWGETSHCFAHVQAPDGQSAIHEALKIVPKEWAAKALESIL